MAGEEETALRSAANAYLDRRMGKPGGIRQGWGGFWTKIFPSLMGVGKKFSWWSFFRLMFQLVMFGATAGFPIVVRKATANTSTPMNSSDPSALVISIYSRWDQIDTWLFVAAVVVAGLPRVLDKLSQRSSREEAPCKSAHHLAKSINDSPFVERRSNGGSPQSAIDHALQALLIDLRNLIEDSAVNPITEVTLLEFCGQRGNMVRVKGRSDVSERQANERTVESWRFMAYYIAQRGNWFAEHNFLSKSNPFPKTRLTVMGERAVTYRSVLYLPITRSREVTPGNVIDECLGVICVHSGDAYRFWQWGDHRHSYGRFGNVAYNKALPYISLIGRLLAPTAQPLLVEKR